MTALSIAAAVATGQISARAVVEECLDRITAHDDDIGAFNLVLTDEALAEADNIDSMVARGEPMGPLAGVPVAVKDNMCTRGIPTTCSSRMLEGWRPPYDATAVQRLRTAGAVVIGKTNLDEFAMGSSTENSAFGPTRNPHDTSRVPGGSSGGSTAAVAAGFAPLALGSDTGGSVRQPAALCGVVGLKPTYGTVSRYGLVAFASSLDQIGPIAADVADTATLYEAIAGHDTLDSTSINRPVPPVRARLQDGMAGMRIGVLAELRGDAVGDASRFDTADAAGDAISDARAVGIEGIASDVSARLAEAVNAIEAAGATAMPVSVPSVALGLSAYYLIAPAEASSNLARYDGVRYGMRVEGATAAEMYTATRTAGFGSEVKRRIMLGTYALSAGYYDAFYGKALRVRTLMLHQFAAVYEHVDLLICPTSPTTAFRLGDKTSDPMLMYLNDVCTIPSNLTGYPAISIPFGTGDDGMPVGVQLMGPALSEGRLFQAAAVLERAAPPPSIPVINTETSMSGTGSTVSPAGVV